MKRTQHRCSPARTRHLLGVSRAFQRLPAGDGLDAEGDLRDPFHGLNRSIIWVCAATRLTIRLPPGLHSWSADGTETPRYMFRGSCSRYS